MNNEFEFMVGTEIGLLDPILLTKESVKWYTIVKIDIDNELDFPIAFLYLESNNSSENIHTTLSNDNNMKVIHYAEMIDSISDLIVIP